jgi:thiol-disulfide isomerase/thioredoxin
MTWTTVAAATALAVCLWSCGAATRATVAKVGGRQAAIAYDLHIVARELRSSTAATAAADATDPFRTASDRLTARGGATDGARDDADDFDDPGDPGDALAGDRDLPRSGAPAPAGVPPGVSRPRGGPRSGPHGKPASSGDSLFDADLGIEDLGAKPVALKEWAGKLTVVNVWATWCGPCRAETPELVKLARDLAPRGIALVGVALDADAVEVRAFMRSYDIEYPMGIGRKKFVSAMHALGVSVSGVPLTLLLDADGRVLESYLGMIHRPALESDIDRYLK